MALKTETNTPEMEERVLKAFLAHPLGEDRTEKDLQLDFEHGQWWVTILGSGAQYSVVDATGGSSVDGFDFEQVTEGDEL